MTVPAKLNPDRELVQSIAMDIGKSAVSHLRVMYPKVYEALPSSGRTSLRNHIHNEIMAALEVMDVDEIESRLKRRAADRRRTHKIYDGLREDEKWKRRSEEQQAVYEMALEGKK